MAESTTRPARQLRKMIAVFGPRKARWMLRRECWGDRSLVSLEYLGRRYHLRLNSTDPLVWFSVFIRQDYGASLPFKPRVIVDAGAYAGFSAVFLANRYPDALVIAIEPDPENFRLLARNVRGYERIRTIHGALWVQDGEIALFRRTEGHWASSVHSVEALPCRPGTEQVVPAVRVETLMSRFDVRDIDLLKIDIEGAEKEVFEQSADWIDRIGAIFIETHDRLRPGCSEAVGRATVGFTRVPASPMTDLLINSKRSTATDVASPRRQ